MNRLKKLRIIEFFIVGVLFGVIEDIIAIIFATGTEITPKVLFVALAVAVPFAFISEIVVDHPRFWQKILPGLKDDHQAKDK